MNPFLYSVYLVVLFIALTAGIINRKQLPGYFQPLYALLAVTFIVETTSLFLLMYTRVNTQPAYHLLLPATYAVHAFVYAKAFNKKTTSQYLYASAALFTILHIILSIWVQPIYVANSYAHMVADVLMVTISLSYLYHLMKERLQTPIQNIPLFWISTGNLFFYSGVFFLLGFLNYLLRTNKELASKLFTIIYLLNYIVYSLYTVGFLSVRKWRKSP